MKTLHPLHALHQAGLSIGLRVLQVALGVGDGAGLWRGIALLLAALLGGCAALPSAGPRPASQALAEAEASPLARAAAAALAGAAPSAFRLLPAGDQALDARIALARGAVRSLDLQYYQLAHDASGLHLLRELRDAARRGVRVRLLVDDLHAIGQDALLASLAARPGVEVRMFNPLPVRGGSLVRRVVLSLHELPRINRRMHNKLFVADNSLAITGGRNIADEYFDRGEPAHFIDMDVLAAGAVVRQLSQVFDRFWNSRHAWPVQPLAGAAAAAAEVDAQLDAAAAPPPANPADALGQSAVSQQLMQGRLALSGAAATVLADDPAKADGGDTNAGADSEVAAGHGALLAQAQHEILIASPYVVPGAAQLAALDAARQRAVQVSVVTNSLSTSDEPLVHSGYARHRQALLAMGVRLYELMPGTLQSLAAPAGGSLGRLHAKLSVVDGRQVFIGSMNLDRRSARLNTELGLVIDSPLLAGQLTRLLQRDRLPASYQLRLAGQRIEWVAGQDANPVVHTREPHADWALGLRLWLGAQFIAEEML